MTDPMPPERLAEIREREDKATRGPWRWQTFGYLADLVGRAGEPGVYEYDTEVVEFSHNGGCGCRQSCEAELTITDADRDFIAHARQDVSDLLVMVEEQARDIERLSQERDEARAKVERVKRLFEDIDYGHVHGEECGTPDCAARHSRRPRRLRGWREEMSEENKIRKAEQRGAAQALRLAAQMLQDLDEESAAVKVSTLIGAYEPLTEADIAAGHRVASELRST